MSRLAPLVVVALAAAALAVGARASAPKLVGSVGPDSNFKITLTQNGKAVTSLKAGTYTFLIKDTAMTHNFHLTGPGVDKATSVSGKGTFTWNLTLKKGTYKYVCDPHASFMKGSFKVS
jgi:plastocyanin